MLFNKVIAALVLSQVVLAAPKPTAESASLTTTTTSTAPTATTTTTTTPHHHGKQGRRHKHYGKSNGSEGHKHNWESKGSHESKTKSSHSENSNEKNLNDNSAPTSTAGDESATATATTTTTTDKATPTSSAGSDDVKSQALAIHNKYREIHHVPDVKWSTKLADHAQTVTDSCVWGHSILKGAGQNIAYGYKSMEAAIDVWYNEGKNYNYGTNSFSSSTGHFTQVVWKSTTEIGCAATYCSNLKGTYYVCDYSPPGNYAGEYTANVLAP